MGHPGGRFVRLTARKVRAYNEPTALPAVLDPNAGVDRSALWKTTMNLGIVTLGGCRRVRMRVARGWPFARSRDLVTSEVARFGVRLPASATPQHSPRKGSGLALALAIVVGAGSLTVSGGCAPTPSEMASQSMRDFPPLEDPSAPPPSTAPQSRPQAGQPDPGTGGTEDGTTRPVPDGTPGSPYVVDMPAPSHVEFSYRFGVGDELSIVVLGQPTFTRLVKVLPDGSFSSPGAGSVFALGRTVSDVSNDIETRLQRFLRYPEVEVVVSAYGEHVIYAMGEVQLPGDHPYRKGMSAMEAVAQAGGFTERGRQTGVVVLRRAGPNTTEFYQLDLKDPLKGEGLTNDMVLQPYDIVHVPRTFIGDVNVFVDQWFRQNVAPLNFYLQGWAAYNTTQDQVIIRTVP